MALAKYRKVTNATATARFVTHEGGCFCGWSEEYLQQVRTTIEWMSRWQ